MTQEALLQKIKHVQALAERGERGERDSARALLARLMEKYNLTEADLENERVETAWFTYRDELERRILQQIIYAVTGKPSFGCVGTYTNRKRKKRGVECTAAEKLEIEANHAFFYEAAKKEMEVFLYAFYMLINFRSRLMAIPARLSPILSKKTDKAEIFKILKAQVDEALNELSDFNALFGEGTESGNEESDG